MAEAFGAQSQIACAEDWLNHQDVTLDLHPSLEQDFKRWQKDVGIDERQHLLALSATEVLAAHFLVADYFVRAGHGIGGVGPKSVHLLHSAVSRQTVGFGGRAKWTDLYGIAATLFFGLVKNHAFHDANKRTALLVALYHLQCHRRIVSVPQKDFEVLAVRVAENHLDLYPAFRDFRKKDDSEVNFISRFFRKGTREIDKREFRITYRQLAALLSRYGFRLADWAQNRVDVVQDVEERHGFFGTKKRTIARRVTTIGFRDWGTEVSLKDIREVRRATGLTTERGYDTAVLMQGLSPMEALISEYSAPLLRLSRK
jgi:death-on-curing protein